MTTKQIKGFAYFALAGAAGVIAAAYIMQAGKDLPVIGDAYDYYR